MVMFIGVPWGGSRRSKVRRLDNTNGESYISNYGCMSMNLVLLGKVPGWYTWGG